MRKVISFILIFLVAGIGSGFLFYSCQGKRKVKNDLSYTNMKAISLKRLQKKLAEGDPLVICDTAPGTSCPVVETLDGCDACILVTESTPFGLHDLRLAVDVATRLGVPIGIVINRSDGQDQATYCQPYG